MSDKKRYMGYNEKAKSLVDVTEEVEEEIADANEPEEVEEEIVEAVNEAAADSTVVGYVSGCIKLNIREEAYIGANVVCIVPEKTALLIEVKDSTDEWYKVYTEAGMEGYCMKQFVTLSE